MNTAASMFAGELSLGSANIEMTDRIIVSTPNIGLHLISAVSYDQSQQDMGTTHENEYTDSLNLSSPGGCKIEMHTFPSG